MKKEKSKKQLLRSWIISLVLVIGLTAIINIAFNVLSGYADLYLGTSKAVITQAEGTEDWDSQYYSSDYASDEEVKTAAEEVVSTIESEGIVLLKNNGVLPLSTSESDQTRITLMGRDSVDAVYGGSGSGSVDIFTVIDLKTGLEASHYVINPEVYALYDEYASYNVGRNQFGAPVKKYENPKADIVMDKPEESNYRIGEMPVSKFTDSTVASFNQYNDAAVLVFGRGGGEGGDLALDMEGSDPNYVSGQHQLELNKDEKDLLALAKANFDKVIVIINASTSMELGILEDDPDIDAILYVGSPGQTGFYAVGEVLNGTVNPSGRTVDLFASDFTKDPTFVNFGFYQYNNISEDNAIGDGFFVQYEEGIYYGYRYYETAANEGFIDYDEAVVYPFGYGLSYTDFDWKVVNQELGNVDGTIQVDVEVTNTGDRAGKDVVQLYYHAPYYDGGIEKAQVVLGDFAKTKLLEPNESEILSLSFPVEDMASYDYKTERAYVLDKGEYEILVQTDSHNRKEGIAPITYDVKKTVVYSGNDHRNSDASEVTNEFDQISNLFTDEPEAGKITNMSRSDFEGTFPTAPTVDDMTANEAIIQSFQEWAIAENLDPEAHMPTTGKQNGINLINMRARDYDDPLWQDFLDQLKPEDVAAIVVNSAYNTGAIESVGKPATVDLDGPAGINSFMGAKISGIAYPSAVMISGTFNKDMASTMGQMIGNEALANGVNGWYAPAVNIHRSPFGGRNFEYYSEDPILSGKIAQSVVEGAASKGVYSFIKHFAMNDQETNRVNNGVSVWANEQAFREIYLKPFEWVVKNSRTNIKYIADDKGTLAEKEIPASMAIMSSFNRIGATWAGGSPELMTNVLRDEWGFQGLAISDFNLYEYMYGNQGIAAGTDIYITFSTSKSLDKVNSPTVANQLRRVAHNLMYTVANSNAMNGIVPGSTVSFTMAPWVKGLIIGDIIIALLLCLRTFFVFKKIKTKED
ncbi:beta-glucosidase [Spirochaeta cellobiosiphila]|uniref:beta-glucosidase n=1 Tax=Spirochaeta cellobiosiphila TaxID=504483 RepID=UPI0003FF5E00|nr:glycoside hydrolase family 3 N-terminal domain-containing protein [Spirochaeta cellobiosiphila]